MQLGQTSIAVDTGTDGVALSVNPDHYARRLQTFADRVSTFMSQLSFLPFSKPTIDEATIAAVGDVLRSGWITSGPKVQAFEAQLSEYFGGRPVRTFNSGTCTMEIALRIAGVGPGDEVITTPISWEIGRASVGKECRSRWLADH